MNDIGALVSLAASLEGRSFSAYKQLTGTWMGNGYTLIIEHVQPDPFSTASMVCLRIAHETHGIPKELWSKPQRAKGLLDYLLRVFSSSAEACPGVGSGRSCGIFVDAGGAEILERSAAAISSDYLSLRFRVGLPARRRTVLGEAAARLLGDVLIRALESVYWRNLDQQSAREWAFIAEEHAHLQDLLKEKGLISFIRDGSVLTPNRDGEPLPFSSPKTRRLTLPTLHHGEISGMAIPEGVTLISGGTFHGKSTLLAAIAAGVYPHVPGDGREWLVTRADAVRVGSQKGRAITGVYLTPLVHDLPSGADTDFFSSANAAAPTSLAADVMEALEIGCSAILLDEDDAVGVSLQRGPCARELLRSETVTPLADVVERLRAAGVSVVVATAGGGEYYQTADLVIMMDKYRARDVTVKAKEIAQKQRSDRRGAKPADVAPLAARERYPLPSSFSSRRRGRTIIGVSGPLTLRFGEETLVFSNGAQLVDESQLRAIGILLELAARYANGARSLRQIVSLVWQKARERGLFAIGNSPELALPRRCEIAAAVNRLARLDLKYPHKG